MILIPSIFSFPLKSYCVLTFWKMKARTIHTEDICPVPTLVLGKCIFHHIKLVMLVGAAMLLRNLAPCLWLIE